MTSKNTNRKPFVDKHYLILLSGLMWLGVGILLNSFACRWLSDYQGSYTWLIVSSGLLISIIKHRFVLSRFAQKNINRIEANGDKQWLFAFITVKSLIMIILMMGTGITLRHSSIPKQYLSVLYIAIGGALILSSIKYFVITVEWMKEKKLAQQ